MAIETFLITCQTAITAKRCPRTDYNDLVTQNAFVLHKNTFSENVLRLLIAAVERVVQFQEFESRDMQVDLYNVHATRRNNLRVHNYCHNVRTDAHRLICIHQISTVGNIKLCSFGKGYTTRPTPSRADPKPFFDIPV